MKNPETFLLKEFELSKGSTDANGVFTGVVISYTKQGETKVTINSEYAEFWSSTPAGLVRKDLIKKGMVFEAMIAQFEAAIITDIIHGKSETGNPSYPDSTLIHVGADEPIQAAAAYQMKAYRTDGIKILVVMYKGKLFADATELASSGTEHATMAFKAEAFEDETKPRDVNYGYIEIGDQIS